MPGPGSLTDSKTLNRGIGGDPEQNILELLRMKFTDDDDPRLFERKQALLREFMRVPESRAAALLAQLERPRKNDEAAELFGKLARSTRKTLLAILTRKSAEFRGLLEGVQTAAVKVRTAAAKALTGKVMARNPRTDARYLDNVYEDVTYDGFSGFFVFRWSEGRKSHELRLSFRHLIQKQINTWTFLTDVYADRDQAELALERWKASTPYANQVELNCAFYRDESGVIVPTTLSSESTPRFWRELPRLRREHQEWRTDQRRGWQMFANAVNLLPFTAVDEYGDLHVDISPSSVLLEVLTLGRGPGKKRTPRVPHVAPSGDPNIIRASPKSYLTYAEFKREQRRTGLGKGIEGHHLVEEQFAKVIGVSPGDILAVPLTPHWHRRTKQGREIWISGRNIDRMITKEMKRKGWRLENPTPAQVWAAHRKVYNDLDSELGSRDWAHAIYEAYFKPLGVPYDALMP